MIISRTPFRISFFGGGTDYPQWYREHTGSVLATTINKYCYITCRYLPPFFDHKSRIIYSKMEHVKRVADIDHPSVRECLKFMKIRDGVEIHHDGDLPARTGLGSSSSFTVGLLNSLYALKGEMASKEQLAREAIYIEQDMCKETVGCQDQTLAAYGGLNYIQFGGNNHLQVQRVTLSEGILENFQDHLMLYFTGFSRYASKIAEHQIQTMEKKKNDLMAIHQMVPCALELLRKDSMRKFGQLLHESWMIKRDLSSKITSDHIDKIYAAARSAGAVGGKLLGAGGGGFMLFFVPPGKQEKVRERLKKLLLVPFKMESLGTQIIFYQPNGEHL